VKVSTDNKQSNAESDSIGMRVRNLGGLGVGLGKNQMGDSFKSSQVFQILSCVYARATGGNE
jgi:hypothetical protein